jgi:hypothetical protein
MDVKRKREVTVMDKESVQQSVRYKTEYILESGLLLERVAAGVGLAL